MKKIIILSFAMVLVISGCSLRSNKPKNLTVDEAKTKALDFINNNLVQPGKTVTIKDITEENGLYKMTVNLSNNQEVVSYMTKDGAKFFPQVMDVVETEKKNDTKNDQANNENNTKEEAANAPKKDKPEVDVFVMSYCPYGTQIEKGIIPVAEALGNKINFNVKFVDYAMHPSQGEVEENLRQYCVQRDERSKFFPYLKCFLKAGDSASCLKEAKVDSGKLKACTDSTDKKYQITEKKNDKSKWSSGSFPPFDINKEDNVKYGVQGSPTLVINGTQISAGRDSKSLLDAICASFTKQPEECKKTLSATAPAPGFGEGAGSGSSAGGCGTN